MEKVAEAQKTIKIENVVASTSINHKIDITSISKKLDGAEYNPERFPGIIYRTKEPKMAALIFSSGKIVCTGAKTIADLEKGTSIIFENLDSLGVDTGGEPDITVQNIVATANLNAVLNLNSITLGLGMENIEYEPEQFPGLVYRLDKPKVVLLIFASGKIVITGCKKSDDAKAAVERIITELDGLALL